MKIPLLLALAGLAIGFAPPAFAQQKDTLGPETAQQVRALASNYDAAFNRHDAVTVAGLYAEDAVFNTPEGTFNDGRANDVFRRGWLRREDLPVVQQTVYVLLIHFASFSMP